MTCFYTKNVHIVCRADITFHFVGRSNVQKKHLWGTNRHFQAKGAKYLNFCTIKTTAAIPTKICTMIYTSKCFLYVVQNCVPHYIRWWTTIILNKNDLLFLIIYTLTLVLQWYFLKRTLQLGGINDPPGVFRVLCHLEIKFQRLYPCFRGHIPLGILVKLLFGDSFTTKFKIAPENRK